MALLPYLRDITFGLTLLYEDLLENPDFAKDLKTEKDLIEQAVCEYDPYELLENKQAENKLEMACSLYEVMSPKEKEKISEDDYIVIGYANTMLAGLQFYQGRWKEALKTIKKSQSMAVGLTKKEKSARNLFFQAEIKAFSARILLSLDEEEKAEKMFQSCFRLYRQALKKSQEPLKDNISLSFQREELEYANICLQSGRREKALEYYRLSAEQGDEPAYKTLYQELLSLFSEDSVEYELLIQLRIMEPLELLPEEQKEEYSYSELEEALLAARLKALLVFQDPLFFDVASFFVSLYDLLYFWFDKIPQEDRLDNSELIALCRLLEKYKSSEFYNRLYQDLWQDCPVSEKQRDVLEEISKAFEALIVTIESPIKVSIEDAFELPDNPEFQVLKQFSKYYEDKSFQEHIRFLPVNEEEEDFVQEENGEEEKEDPDSFDLFPVLAYLFLVAAINSNEDRFGLSAYDSTFFDLCDFLMTNCHYYSESDDEEGYFFGHQAIECIGKDKPIKWLDTYMNTIDFYSIFYNLCFATGHDDEGYKYRYKVDEIKSNLYRSGFYDQDDWMFR